MTKQVVKLWESVLCQLAALSKISSTTPADCSLQDAALLRVEALLKQVLTCDTPQRAWKRIINEIKVGVCYSLKLSVVQQIRCEPRSCLPYTCLSCPVIGAACL